MKTSIVTAVVVVTCGALGGALLRAEQPPTSTTTGQPPTSTTTAQPPTSTTTAQPPTSTTTAQPPATTTGTSGTSEPKTVWSGVYSEAQAKRGSDIYTNQCSSCHGPDLAGLDTAPPLTGADFNTDWNDLTVNDLFERIRVSMPADHPGTLSRQDVADVLAFLLSKGNFPAGQADLPTQAEMLKDIKYVSARPQ